MKRRDFFAVIAGGLAAVSAKKKEEPFVGIDLGSGESVGVNCYYGKNGDGVLGWYELPNYPSVARSVQYATKDELIEETDLYPVRPKILI